MDIASVVMAGRCYFGCIRGGDVGDAARARIRYAAGCLAMLAMFGAFVITLGHLWPEGQRDVPMLGTPALQAQNGRFSSTMSGSWELTLAGIAPWRRSGRKSLPG